MVHTVGELPWKIIASENIGRFSSCIPTAQDPNAYHAEQDPSLEFFTGP